MTICPETFGNSSISSPTGRDSTRYLLKNDLGYLNRPYAVIAELVEESANVSEVATMTRSSPNLERHARALVKSDEHEQRALQKIAQETHA